ncbi:Phosphate-specific outer membrane porin OprP/Pyrophosphate-specific outer membrane porin OprO [Methylophaga thiooxydans]|uniref:Phosphate-specific outer membrane porin OprP/Pyrophosphate-specific outer membrane porin OprO n=1 Tax=Methylophaga thiooxydans TaxID=392484 RepID=A0A0A0BI95_9GAMM|nr:porin [Methylophaga thiooxydans]KGM07610.1 Phosphate-specific outer membrane porin OprP/Pyrophosphate-specific outer membrane porin OprO [Methylophaga thiooxydans]
MKLKTTSLLIAGTLFGAAMMPAHANNEAMIDLLKVLRDKGTISADDYNMLKNAAAADKEMAEAEKAEIKEEAVAAAKADMPKITTDGKLKIEDQDGNWSFQPIGRVMWDAVNADADTNDSDDDVKGTELRRARLGFAGSIYDWSYKFEADFAGGDASIKDAYIGYGNKLSDNTKWGVKLGQSHIPFGLNTKISSKYMTFMDRPMFADSSVSPARASGAVVSINDSDYKWALSAGLQNGGFDGDNDTYEINGSTFAVRGSFLPYNEGKNLVQIGAGYLTQGGGDSFKFQPDLVSHDDKFKPVSTGTIALDQADAFTVDAMGVFGSFHAMAEYLDHTAEPEAGSDIDTTGYAVEAGYFLTGESLKWKKGYTSGISPKSKYGAWQVAARFESVEVDPGTSMEDEYDQFTLGVNYYPTKNTRLMLNYSKVTDLTVDGTGADEEPSALKFRAQAYW